MQGIDTGKENEPDKKHRVSLGTAVTTPEGVRYRVMQNEFGHLLKAQIIVTFLKRTQKTRLLQLIEFFGVTFRPKTLLRKWAI